MSDLMALRRPSVVTFTPSVVARVMSTLASKAVECALGLQNTSSDCKSCDPGSPVHVHMQMVVLAHLLGGVLP